jgi:RNA polymerase sigma factor (sigma-70 family)
VVTNSRFRRLYSKGQKYSDDEIVEGIRNGDNNIYEYIYTEYFLQILNNLIKGEKLEEQDAKDIFQDGMIILCGNLQKPDFILKNSFIFYFIGICRKLLMDRLKMEYKISREEGGELDLLPIEANEIVSDFYPFTDSENIGNVEIEFQIFSKHFLQLKEDCKKVLKMYYANCSYDEIAQIMGYKKGTFAKNKKRRCKKYLMDSISKDKMYQFINN